MQQTVHAAAVTELRSELRTEKREIYTTGDDIEKKNRAAAQYGFKAASDPCQPVVKAETLVSLPKLRLRFERPQPALSRQSTRWHLLSCFWR